MSNLKCCTPDSNCNLPTPCVNPLIHLMKMVLGRATDGYTLPTAFTYVLANGILISGSEKYCCPDCTAENGFYFLGGITAFSSLCLQKGLGVDGINELPVNPLLKYPCCIKTSTSTAAHNLLDTTFITRDELTNLPIMDKTPACCPVDFTAPMQRLVMETESDNSVDQAGWVEASGFKGKSGIDIILDFLDSLTPTITKAEKTLIFNTISTAGLYIECNGCDMRISRANPYWDYYYNRH